MKTYLAGIMLMSFIAPAATFASTSMHGAPVPTAHHAATTTHAKLPANPQMTYAETVTHTMAPTTAPATAPTAASSTKSKPHGAGGFLGKLLHA